MQMKSTFFGRTIITLSIVLLQFVLFIPYATSQEVIDQVVAVVGGDKILLSDIEQEALRVKMQGMQVEDNIRCQILEEMLIHKMLLHHAQLDSIQVNEFMVESEMDRRLKYFTSQVGSEAALEKYFNKTIFQIKDDLRELIRETQLTQQMRSKIVDKVNVTPSEVKRFFKEIPKDSLPQIPEQFEYRQIAIYPPAGAEAKFMVREKLLELRERIVKGERFAPLAVAYSEDRASATRGGELGFRSRDELVKAFADAAFSLKQGQVSNIVETEYGHHIIQLIEKKNDQVNVRHILMKPVYTSDMISKAQSRLDSIAVLVRQDSTTFIRAAQRYSEDVKTRLSGGLVINPQTGTALFEKEQIQPADFYALKNMLPGEISEPFESRDQHANIVYKIVLLTRIVPAHTANINDDYAILQQMAKRVKEHEKFMGWVEKKKKTTYIRIDTEFKNCKFEQKDWIK
jgi:peptidyl-prolyl cis-trans isomerase SurA